MKYSYSPKIDLMGFEKNSAIFVPILLPKDNKDLQLKEPHFLFEVRSSTLRQQPSEICFPGGKIEKGETPESAALRETCEELLLSYEQLEVLTSTDFVTTPANRVLYPYIGLLKQYNNTFSKDEVEKTFLVPLSFFEQTKPTLYYHTVTITPSEHFPMEKMPNKTSYTFEQGTYPVPFYEYDNYTIWGMTARVIQASLPRLEEIKHELY